MKGLHWIVLHEWLLFSTRFFYSFSIHHLTLLFFFSFFFFCVCVMLQVCAILDLGEYFIILGTQSLKGMGLFLFSLFMDYFEIARSLLCILRWIWVYLEWVFSVCVWFGILGWLWPCWYACGFYSVGFVCVLHSCPIYICSV